jgi:dihydroxyacid dehydratase/phosphogluconate dehydratase
MPQKATAKHSACKDEMKRFTCPAFMAEQQEKIKSDCSSSTFSVPLRYFVVLILELAG